MRVVVDFESCELNGLCVVEAPAVFQVVGQGADEQLEVLMPEPPEELRGPVLAARDVCPKEAIRVEEP